MTDFVDAFLLEIGMRPDDNGLRAVFADWLLERNDPRGELIMLQLLATATPEQREKIRQLVERHGISWLPVELQQRVDPCSLRFDRGVLVGCRLNAHDGLGRLSEDLLLNPMWALIRELAAPPIEVVQQCPNLERLIELENETAARLDEVSHGLAFLKVLGVWKRRSGPVAVPRRLALPRLEELRLALPPPAPSSGDPWEEEMRQRFGLHLSGLGKEFRQASFAKRLKRVVVHGGRHNLADFFQDLERAPLPVHQVAIAGARLPPLSNVPDWEIRFSARAARRFRDVQILPGCDHAVALEAMLTILSTAPPDFFERLEAPPEMSKLRALACFRTCEEDKL